MKTHTNRNSRWSSISRIDERSPPSDRDLASGCVLPSWDFSFPSSIAMRACAQTVLARIVCTVIHYIGQCGKASCLPNDVTVLVRDWYIKKNLVRDRMVVRYRLAHMHSDEPCEASEKSIHPDDMRGVGKESFPRLASFLISLDKGGQGIGSPWLTPRTTNSGRVSHHRGLPRGESKDGPAG